MKDEIKEIIDRLKRIDHKEYIAFEFADSATFDEMAKCFEERKKMADYITNLQQKNENAIELCKSLIIFWKKYTNDNSLEVGQLENIIGQLNGDDLNDK